MADNSSNPRTYAEQLAEMRAARMQQARVASQTIQMEAKQLSALTALATAINRQNNILASINREEKNIVKSNIGVSKSIEGMGKSLERSLTGAISGIAKGIKGTAGVAASGISSLSSLILTGLAKTLPVGIIGFIGKSLVWDNMDDSVKDRLRNSISSLFSGMFESFQGTEVGKLIKPLIQQVEVVFNVMKDMFQDLIHTMSVNLNGLFKTLSENFDVILKNLEIKYKVIKDIVGEVGKVVEQLPDLKTAIETIGALSAAVGGAKLAGKIRENMPSKAPAAGGAASGAADDAAKAASAAAGARPDSGGQNTQPRQGNQPGPRRGPGVKPSSRFKPELDAIRRAGAKVTPENIIKSRLFNVISKTLGATSAGGQKIMAAVKVAGGAAKIYKIPFLGMAIAAGLEYYLVREINKTVEEGLITREQGDYIIKKSVYESTGSIVGSLLGGIGLSALGPLGTVGGAIGGSIAGEKAGGYVFEQLNEPPQGMFDEVQLESDDNARDVLGKVRDQSVRDQRDKEKEVPAGAKSKKDEVQRTDAPAVAVPIPSDRPSKHIPDTSKLDINNLPIETIKKYIGGAETSKDGGYNTKNQGGSSATGRYQFLKDTFELFAQDKKSPVYGMKWDDYIKNPAAQEKLVEYSLKQDAAILDSKNIPVNAETLYLAHHLGVSRAANVYTELLKNPDSKLKNFFPTKGRGNWDIARTQNKWDDNITLGDYFERTVIKGLARGGYKRNDADIALAAQGLVSNNRPKDSSDNIVPEVSQSETHGMSMLDRYKYYENKFRSKDDEGKKNKPEEGVGTSLMRLLKMSPENITQQFVEKFDKVMESDNKIPTNVVVNNVGGDTVMVTNTSGGGGGSAIQGTLPTPRYSDEFTSLSGVRRF